MYISPTEVEGEVIQWGGFEEEDLREAVQAIEQLRLFVLEVVNELREAYRLINQIVGINLAQLSDTALPRYYQNVERFKGIYNRIMYKYDFYSCISYYKDYEKSSAIVTGLVDGAGNDISQMIIAFDSGIHLQHSQGPFLEWAIVETFEKRITSSRVREILYDFWHEVLDTEQPGFVVKGHSYIFKPLHEFLDYKAIAHFKRKLLRFAQALQRFSREQGTIMRVLYV